MGCLGTLALACVDVSPRHIFRGVRSREDLFTKSSHV